MVALTCRRRGENAGAVGINRAREAMGLSLKNQRGFRGGSHDKATEHRRTDAVFCAKEFARSKTGADTTLPSSMDEKPQGLPPGEVLSLSRESNLSNGRLRISMATITCVRLFHVTRGPSIKPSPKAKQPAITSLSLVSQTIPRDDNRLPSKARWLRGETQRRRRRSWQSSQRPTSNRSEAAVHQMTNSKSYSQGRC